MTSGSKDALAALRCVNPRHGEGFEELAATCEGIADRIVAESAADILPADAVTAGATAVAGRPPAHASGEARSSRWRRRVVGLAVAGCAVIAAGAVAGAILLTGGDRVITPAYAAAAVKKAAVDTSAAARSGVIETRLAYEFVAGGAAASTNTFSWNGDDVALMAENDPQRQVRYVDGKYYETSATAGLPMPGIGISGCTAATTMTAGPPRPV